MVGPFELSYRIKMGMIERQGGSEVHHPQDQEDAGTELNA